MQEKTTRKFEAAENAAVMNSKRTRAKGIGEDALSGGAKKARI
jgi:hypothetical protein